MRFQRLDLLRYGHFTEKHIELPSRPSDFHILYGPNEAGKSTALAAIEDLLFGIPGTSPYTFLHANNTLRIGALLQQEDKTLELRRRKGNKDTLLNADDLPFAGGTNPLAPYLNGIDRAFFTRMFCLGHERLRKGGQDILEARDEVGQTLFSAGSGLPGLRDTLASLIKEADDAWGPRKAAHRKYYQAAERLDQSEKQLREFTLSAAKWQEAKSASDSAADAYEALEKKIEEVSTEQRKLSRIRRVYRDVKQLTTLQYQILAVGEVCVLPENAFSSVDAAERELGNAAARVDTLKKERERERKDREGLKPDEALLRRCDDIQDFHTRRIEVQKGKADLPRRKAELAVAEAELQKLAQELQWSSGDIAQIVSRIPDRARVAAVRSLLNARGEKISCVAAAKTALEDNDRQITDMEHERARIPPLSDSSGLSAVLAAARQNSDIVARINAAEIALEETEVHLRRHLIALNPQVEGEDVLVSLNAAQRDTILHQRDAVLAADRKIEGCRERIFCAEQKLRNQQRARERLVREEGAIEATDIAKARARRDAGWVLVRQRYIDGITIPDAEIETFTGGQANLPSTFEATIATADKLADQRFEHTEAAAQISVTTRQIAETQEQLVNLRQEESRLVDERQSLDGIWKGIWSEAPFEPLSPDAMLEWLNIRQEFLEAHTRRTNLNIQLQSLRREELRLIASILTELAAVAFDVEPLKRQPLPVVLEAASAWEKHCETNAFQRQQLKDRLKKVSSERQRKRDALDAAERAQTEWGAQWTASVRALGLDPEALPEVTASQLDQIERMREIAREIDHLRHERIGRIEKDIEAFAQDLSPLVTALAVDLVSATPDDAILGLEHRLEEAKRLRDERRNKDTAIGHLEKRIAECEASVSQAHETIRRLSQLASVSDIDQLKIAIRNSDNLRDLKQKLAATTTTLDREGEGLTSEELIRDCNVPDIDQLAAREETLRGELKSLRDQLVQAAQLKSETRKALAAFAGESRAAEAAALRQAALTQMREAAEEYVRVRTSAALLQWAIKRYRQEKQAPLLKRAGEIFARLTDNSFSGLTLDFDDQDNPHLAGVRPDRKLVRTSGLSTGTADQLFLALRLASIDDYLTRASAIPFIADDLLIHFDDKRATAGFKALADLGKKTQILFFTHHDHQIGSAHV